MTWDLIWFKDVRKLYFFYTASLLQLSRRFAFGNWTQFTSNAARRSIESACAASDTGPLSVNREHRSGAPTHSADSIMQPTQQTLFGCALVLHTWEQPAEVQLQKAESVPPSVAPVLYLHVSGSIPVSILCQLRSPKSTSVEVKIHERVQMWHSGFLNVAFSSQFQKEAAEPIKCFLLVAVGHHSNTCTWMFNSVKPSVLSIVINRLSPFTCNYYSFH